MNQSDDQKTPDVSPPIIQPTLKMALFIQYLQNHPIETVDDCEAAIKYWDENNLTTLGNGLDKDDQQSRRGTF